MANKLKERWETEDGKDNTMKPLAMKSSGDNQKIINGLATLLCKTCPTNWEKVRFYLETYNHSIQWKAVCFLKEKQTEPLKEFPLDLDQKEIGRASCRERV